MVTKRENGHVQEPKQELCPQFWFGGRYISGPIKTFVIILTKTQKLGRIDRG